MTIEEVKHVDVHMEEEDIQLLEKTSELLTTIMDYMIDYGCQYAEYRDSGYLDCVDYSEIEEAKRIISHLTTTKAFS